MSTPESTPGEQPDHGDEYVEPINPGDIDELVREIRYGHGDIPEHVEDIIVRLEYDPDTELEAQLRALIGHYIEPDNNPS